MLKLSFCALRFDLLIAFFLTQKRNCAGIAGNLWSDDDSALSYITDVLARLYAL